MKRPYLDYLIEIPSSLDSVEMGVVSVTPHNTLIPLVHNKLTLFRESEDEKEYHGKSRKPSFSQGLKILKYFNHPQGRYGEKKIVTNVKPKSDVEYAVEEAFRNAFEKLILTEMGRI